MRTHDSWPTHRGRKRGRRRGRRRRDQLPPPEPTPTSYNRVARQLVDRGLASPAILGHTHTTSRPTGQDTPGGGVQS